MCGMREKGKIQRKNTGNAGSLLLVNFVGIFDQKPANLHARKIAEREAALSIEWTSEDKEIIVPSGKFRAVEDGSYFFVVNNFRLFWIQLMDKILL